MIFLVHCIISLFYDVVSCPPVLRNIFHMPVARCSLFYWKCS